jgi:hypothetical protein
MNNYNYIMDNYKLNMLTDDNQADTRYTMRVNTFNRYISYFCNVAIHSQACSVQSSLIRAKAHQTKQVLRGLNV